MSKLTANLLLLFAAALWGFGNVAQKTVLDHLDALSAVGLRCLIGGLLVLPFVAIERRAPVDAAHSASLARVVVLFAVSIMLQQLCYLGASVTNASFLISTATVITPLAAWLLMGERPTAGLIIAAGATVFGCLLLSGGVAGFSGSDLTALLSAGCYALWTVELGRHMHAHGRPFTAAATQFLAGAAIALPLGAMQGDLSFTAVFEAGPELVVLGVFSTAVAFSIQIAALRFTSASHAAVIVSAESVFGAMGAAIFLGERNSAAGALGAAIILGSILSVAMSNRATSLRVGPGGSDAALPAGVRPGERLPSSPMRAARKRSTNPVGDAPPLSRRPIPNRIENDLYRDGG